MGSWHSLPSNPRLTMHIDFPVGVDEKNIECITQALNDFGIKGVPGQFFRIEDNTFRIGSAPLRIDILNKALGIEFESCYRRKKALRIDVVSIKLISKNDLMKSKLAANRKKDLADVVELNRIE